MKHFAYSWMAAALLGLLGLAAPRAARAQAPAWQTLSVAAPTGANPLLTNTCQVQAAATDATGNVFVAGTFTGTVDFGSTRLTNIGFLDQDVFVAKWSPGTGNFVWALRAGGTGQDGATAVAVSGTSVYVAGGFTSGNADFGPVTLSDANPATTDMFVAKVADAGPTGSFVWAQQAGGTGADRANALAVSGPNVYVAGFYQGGRAVFGTDTLALVGASNMFVARLTDAGATGRFAWAKGSGSFGYAQATALAASGANVYVAGEYTDQAVPAGSLVPDAHDVFVFKYVDENGQGSFRWVQQAIGTGNDRATALAVRGTSLYVAGDFASPTLAVGTGRTVLTNTATDGSYDAFVLKLDDVGIGADYVWAQRAGGPGNDYVHALAVSSAGVYVAGDFAGATADFGATTLTNAGLTDAYAAKLLDAGASGSFAWARQAGGAGVDGAAALALSGAVVYVGGSAFPVANFGPFALSGLAGHQAGFLASLIDARELASRTGSFPGAGLGLFPNPVQRTATATVLVPAVPGAAQVVLTLFDALGRAVRTRTAALPATGLRTELDVAGLPGGVYALRVAAGSIAATRPLVVE